MIKKISLIGILTLLYIIAAHSIIVIIVRLFLRVNNIIPFNFFHPNIIVNYLIPSIAIYSILKINKISNKNKLNKSLWKIKTTVILLIITLFYFNIYINQSRKG